MKTELYLHQVLGLEMLRDAMREGKTRPMLMLPTGSGKTVLAGAVIESAMARGKWKRLAFLVPRIDLVLQTQRAFWAEGIRDVGVMQGADHPETNPDAPIQICSIQTLMRREAVDVDAIIADEAHLVFKWFTDWIGTHDKPVIGMSATPWTRGLGKYYNALLIPTTTQELIDKGLLSPFKVYAPSSPDLASVKVVAGDYHEGQLSAAMQAGTLVADAVETWHAHGEPSKTILFAVDRAHAKKLQSQFHELGYEAGYIDGTTPREQRDVIRAQFHAEEMKVLCSVDVLTIGIDWDCRAIIYCRPTKSIIRHVQAIGRGLRTAEGKEELIVLDHSDTHLRLGFVTDIHKDALHDGKPAPRGKQQEERGPRLPTPCPKCGVLRAVGMGCLACGAEPVVSEVVHVAGQLSLLEAGEKRKLSKAPKADKQAWWSQFLWIAREKRYKAGWAGHCYREKFGGIWPRGLMDTPIRPTSEVYSWLAHRAIKQRASRQREQERQRA